jgi:ADP-ribose pyrophosphatase
MKCAAVASPQSYQPQKIIPLAYIISMPKSHLTKLSRSKSSRPKSKARLLSSKVVYRGPAFWVSFDEVLEPTGVRARRDIVHHTGSVVILAVEENQPEPRLLLERQYRHAAQSFLWELPAGRIDKGEKDLAAAKRELLEETGYTAKSWKRILRFYASPGFVAETMAIFLARDLRSGTAQPEADEVIQVHFLPLSEAVRMVMGGRIRDAKTIVGVLWLSQQQKKAKPHK